MKRRIDRITFPRRRLTHQDAMALRADISTKPPGRVVVLDLRQTTETTTAALAALILLRRERIAADGDLLLLGLSGKAHYLYEILRLAKVLPRRPCMSPRRHLQRSEGRACDRAGKQALAIESCACESSDVMA